MFTESADIYDLVYSFKDYKKESEDIASIIRSRHPQSKNILDIGCGTAEHHKYLQESFSIDGIDLNEKFIELAKQKNPKGNYTVADMASFDLNKEYDVITCLFSSIGYLKTFEQIVSALKCLRRHLNQNGLIIIEPWFSKENYSAKMGMTNYDTDDLKICRMSHGHPEGDLSILNFHYLIATLDKGVQHFHEIHELRMTSREEMFKAFEAAGLEVSFDPEGLIGRGLYYGSVKDNVADTQQKPVTGAK